MPIKFGTKNISAIYYGDKPISKVYYGTTLVFSSYTWENAYFEYLYNSLVPSTINNKQVKNKARVNTIYGNSVVENQQFNSFRTVSTNGCTITPLANGRGFHIQGTAESAGNTWVVNLESDYTRFANHKMLLINKTNIVVRNNDFGRNKTEIGQIAAQYFVVDMIANTTYNDDVELQLIDLTQYDPFTSTWSLLDTRVQALINRGYIAPNTGTIKSVDVSEISSEPYNLWDEQWELGSIDGSTGQNESSTSRIRTTNYVPVIPNTTYTITVDKNQRVSWYNNNKVFIKSETYLSGNRNITSPSNAYYCRFIINETDYTYKCAFHLASANYGYKPHTNPQSITFKYQGSGVGTAHDTMEITNTEYVFTKNTMIETIKDVLSSGSNWSKSSSIGWYSKPIQAKVKRPVDNNTLANVIAVGYITSISAYSDNLKCRLNASDGRLWLSNSLWETWTGSQVAEEVADIPFEYELATPQVIRIPKKHLGIARIRDLSWTYNSNGYLQTTIRGKVSGNSNVVCSIYNYHGNVENPETEVSVNNTLYTYSYGKSIFIKDTKYNNTTDFVNDMGDYLIFYETEDEVADIPTTFGIESGGTITTDSEVLPNAYLQLKAK